jgi:hypothetical protein
MKVGLRLGGFRERQEFGAEPRRARVIAAASDRRNAETGLTGWKQTGPVGIDSLDNRTYLA